MQLVEIILQYVRPILGAVEDNELSDRPSSRWAAMALNELKAAPAEKLIYEPEQATAHLTAAAAHFACAAANVYQQADFLTLFSCVEDLEELAAELDVYDHEDDLAQVMKELSENSVALVDMVDRLNEGQAEVEDREHLILMACDVVRLLKAVLEYADHLAE